jgi:ABC-type phosphate/phosphonate transport system substrate-binding protein
VSVLRGCDINSQSISRILLLLVVFLVACRRETGPQGPFIAATATATPLSTPLPALATVEPPGIEENPIQMVINPVGAASLVTSAQIDRLQAALAEDSGLVVEITVVERYAEALAALCESDPSNVTVAWLDGITYQAARALNCGSPSLQIERGRTASTGAAGQIITRRSLGLTSVQALRNRDFCRLGLDDYYSWLVPALMLRANGVDPINDLSAVREYDTTNALIGAVLAGECTATGISQTEFEGLRGEVRDELRVVETTPPFPYAILVYPLSLPLGERIRLDNALLALDLDNEGRSALRPFLRQDGLTRVDDSMFEDLSAFMADTGLDFAQLGS